jgi:hypothetical protein
MMINVSTMGSSLLIVLDGRRPDHAANHHRSTVFDRDFVAGRCEG